MALFRYTWRTFGRELFLLLLGVLFFIPLYLMLVLTFGDAHDTLLHPLTPPSPTTSNLKEVWNSGGTVSFGMALVNSLIITISAVVLLIVTGSVCAYAIARRGQKLGTFLYLVFVSGLIIPFQLGIIPAYVAMRKLNLVGNYLGMIVLEVGLLMPIVVFLYVGFIRALPRDYEEAAQVDGAGLIRTYFRVVFPLLRPVTGTAAVLAGVVIWNDFFNSLIFLSGTDKVTVPVKIYSFVGEFSSQWNLIFAGIAISLAPIVLFYLLAQQQLIRGFSGGMKG